jgi:hypothetical protein
MPSKILNIFELLIFLLIANKLRIHYFVYNPFGGNSSFLFQLLIDSLLGIVIFIRVKDLIFNFNHKDNSSKKFYFPLLLYSIVTISNIWYLIKISSHYNPILTFASFVFVLLPIIILLGRIIFTKNRLEKDGYSEDILDL